MKRCSKCKDSFDLSQFGLRADGSRQPQCKSCQRLSSKEWYNNNKKHHVASVRSNTSRYRRAFQKWKATLSCLLCGENTPICLEFHHVNDDTKDFNISDPGVHSSLGKMVQELNKCVVLCANCHRKVHAGIRKLPPDVKCLRVTKADFASVA